MFFLKEDYEFPGLEDITNAIKQDREETLGTKRDKMMAGDVFVKMYNKKWARGVVKVFKGEEIFIDGTMKTQIKFEQYLGSNKGVLKTEYFIEASDSKIEVYKNLDMKPVAVIKVKDWYEEFGEIEDKLLEIIQY
jgi:hypothetical protein